MTLTVQAIAAAKPGDIIRDAEVAGLHVRVFPSRKSFYLYYRTRAGEERRPKLGDYGTFTINDARRLARKMLMEVAEGKDPSGKWKADRAGMLVGELVDLYVEHKLAKRKSAKSIKTNLRYIREELGARRVATLELSDAETLHRKITKDNGPIQANRVLTSLSALLSLAEKHKLRDLGSNFCKYVERNQERKRRRYLTPGDEAKGVGAALRKRLYGPWHESVLLIYLLMLTGARKGELTKAKVKQREGDKIVLQEHKTDADIGDKIIRLPAAAIELLDDPKRPVHLRRGYLLGVSDCRKVWAAVAKDAGCPDLRIHDLRHSFASFGLGAKVGLGIVAELLSHASTQTTKRYAHLIEDAGREAVNTIGDAVTAALE